MWNDVRELRLRTSIRAANLPNNCAGETNVLAMKNSPSRTITSLANVHLETDMAIRSVQSIQEAQSADLNCWARNHAGSTSSKTTMAARAQQKWLPDVELGRVVNDLCQSSSRSLDRRSCTRAIQLFEDVIAFPGPFIRGSLLQIIWRGFSVSDRRSISMARRRGSRVQMVSRLPRRAIATSAYDRQAVSGPHLLGCQ